MANIPRIAMSPKARSGLGTSNQVCVSWNGKTVSYGCCTSSYELTAFGLLRGIVNHHPVSQRVPSGSLQTRQICLEDLKRCPKPALRVMCVLFDSQAVPIECQLLITCRFAPLATPLPETVDLLKALFQYFRFPPCYLSENILSVTHSFGARKGEDGRHCDWAPCSYRGIVVLTKQSHGSPFYARMSTFRLPRACPG